MAGARDEVVVHHAACLHERIADRRTDKLESTFQQVLAQRIALDASRGKLLERPTAVHDGFAADETPKVVVEAAELRLHREKCAGIGNRGQDLKPVAHNTLILKQGANLPVLVLGNFAGIEIIKRQPITISLGQDDRPTQACLRSFQS